MRARASERARSSSARGDPKPLTHVLCAPLGRNDPSPRARRQQRGARHTARNAPHARAPQRVLRCAAPLALTHPPRAPRERDKQRGFKSDGVASTLLLPPAAPRGDGKQCKRISAAIVWERASQLFRRQRDASLAHLTPDEIAMHPGGHALLEAP